MMITTEAAEPRDLETQGLIDSLINRAERILARDLTAPVVQRALVRLAQDKTLALLLDKAATAATVEMFDIDLREAPAPGDKPISTSEQ
jgi:hypothetical protein